jgi:hypothetical protein
MPQENFWPSLEISTGVSAETTLYRILAPGKERKKPSPARSFQNAEQDLAAKE